MSTVFVQHTICDYPGCESGLLLEEDAQPVDLYVHFPRNRGHKPKVWRVDMCHAHADIMREVFAVARKKGTRT